MRRVKIVSLFAAVLALIFLFILFFRVGGQLYRNQQFNDSFSYNGGMEQYQRVVPMDEMDLTEYGTPGNS